VSRVKKTTACGTGTEETLAIGSLFEKTSRDGDPAVTTRHIFAGSRRICSVETDTATQQSTCRYIHSDHLGSANVVTDEAGLQLAHYEYAPYGSVARTEGLDVSAHKFTGKELDETGLYFYSARYYDPVLGRFVTPDIFVQSPYDPQSLNRYAYCRNNPVNLVDPTGHFWGAIFAVIWAVAKAATVGAAIGAAGAAITGGDAGQGALLGAAAGAFTGGLGFLGAPGIVAGAAGGSATAGIFGMDVGIGAICGALGGAIGQGLGDWASGWTEGSFWGGLGAAALAGGIAGGVGAELSGGKFGRGFGAGAAYASGGYLGTNAVNNLNPRYRKSRIYEEKLKQIRALAIKKGNMVDIRVSSRDVGGGPFKHKSIEGWQMGPEYEGGPIATTDTAQDLTKWKTHIATVNSKADVTIVWVSAWGLGEAKNLYNSTWAGGDTPYVGTSYNSNYAADTVVYGAGGNVPGGLGLVPAFGNIAYVPTVYADN